MILDLKAQLFVVFLIFLIYLLPRVYKNFLLTCIVYVVIILVDDDQYFKECSHSDDLCKMLNIAFMVVFAIHLLFGVLLIVGDIKNKNLLMLPWLLWWIIPTIGIVFIALNNGYVYLALAGWIAIMCLDIYLFKYKKCQDSDKVTLDDEHGDVGDSIDNSELRLIASGKFQQSDLWC